MVQLERGGQGAKPCLPLLAVVATVTCLAGAVVLNDAFAVSTPRR